jgi:hypothetical protein
VRVGLCGVGILGADSGAGTANVLESESKRPGGHAAGREAGLKYDKTGKILLVPQPSDDPNDPLVWFPSPQHTSNRKERTIYREEECNANMRRTGPSGNATSS